MKYDCVCWALWVSSFGWVYPTSVPYVRRLYDFVTFYRCYARVKGSRWSPVLWRGGRTTRGVYPSIDRVKSTGVMKIHIPLPLYFGSIVWLRRRCSIYSPSERRISQVVWALCNPSMCCAAPAKRMKGSSSSFWVSLRSLSISFIDMWAGAG